MNWSQTVAIILSIMLPMVIGFWWIIFQIVKIKVRLNIIERILAMKGEPIKSISHDQLE